MEKESYDLTYWDLLNPTNNRPKKAQLCTNVAAGPWALVLGACLMCRRMQMPYHLDELKVAQRC